MIDDELNNHLIINPIDSHCSLQAFKFPGVIIGKVDAIIRSSVCDHCNFRFLSGHILSVKIPSDRGLTRFALDFDLLKDRNIC